MELLVINHEDFDLTIESTQFTKAWEKATNNIPEENLMSTYNWSDGVISVIRKNGDEISVLFQEEKAPAIFFDNTDYPLWVDFKENNIQTASYGSNQQEVNDNFSFHKKRQVLSGFLNYGNEIGKSEIVIDYTFKDGKKKQFKFFFEVLSTKLNYHEHWKQILIDIEKEYRMLSLDFLKRTYHSFTIDNQENTPDLIWWSIFKKEQDKFIEACKKILERPRHRLKDKILYLRADRIQKFTPTLEQEFAEHKKEVSHLYQTKEQSLSNDTPENRFLKYALNHITAKYNALKKRINMISGPSEALINAMDENSIQLSRLVKHPFFRTIGTFKGMNQESMILQRATGYSQVYRTWLLLHQSYSLNDGLYNLETKDIATLYEIWCFIEMRKIVKKQLGNDIEDLQNNRTEMNRLFSYELSKGEASRVLFRKGNIQLAELVYNPKNGEEENETAGIEHWVSSTVPQKPDIVLQLIKDDLEAGMKLTYLFDAKYRLANHVQGVDTPPNDAINQMHRYRDAIYYKENNKATLKKEVIGGYILFPGNGTPLKVQEANFYKSIKEVNIGAFPLRPGDTENRILLEKFVDRLINEKSQDIMSDIIPQKGTVIEIHNRVLVGFVKHNEKDFEQGIATRYFTRENFPTTIPLDGLHYFAPYLKGKGIRDIYEITKIHTITSAEVKVEGGNKLRIAFELGKRIKSFDDYVMIDLPIERAFNDTTLDKLPH